MNPKDLVGAKKAPLAVVPPTLTAYVAPAMAFGANKYGPYNWREQPVQGMTYVEAALRHLYAWIDGEELASDSGVSHIAHAIAGLAILADAMSMPGGEGWIDNRPPKGGLPDLLRAQDKSVAPADAEPKVYEAPPCQPERCVECEYILPEHGIECSKFGRITTETWGMGDGPVIRPYRGNDPIEAPDGCFVYRGRHVHPTVATPTTFRSIDRDMDDGIDIPYYRP